MPGGTRAGVCESRWMRSDIVTMLTDFGGRDPYVGILKGVILSLHPQARLVDLAHQVGAQDIRQGAFLLATAVDWFPRGTVHLAVVDPGVGGQRRALAVQGERHFYVGPDNGILSLAMRRDRPVAVVELRPGPWSLEKVSRTFHGRDLFAPAAAHLARGVALENLGTPVNDHVELNLEPNRLEDGCVRTQVIHCDAFGNLVTLLHRSEVEGGLSSVRVGGTEIPVCATYGDVDSGQLLACWGSADYLEIAVNRGSAAQRLGVAADAPVEVLLTCQNRL